MSPQELFEYEILSDSNVKSPEDSYLIARARAKTMCGYVHLISFGIMNFYYENREPANIGFQNGMYEFKICYSIRLSEKGIRWIKYISKKNIEEIRGYSHLISF